MHIRKIEQKDIVSISSICIKAFMSSVAPNLSNEGVVTFRKIASEESFLSRIQDDNVLLVAETDGKVQGVIELKEGRHIAMFFVNPDIQNQGIGRKLIAAVLVYTRVDVVTVSASLNSVPIYHKYGFDLAGEPSETSGLKYQPMELKIDQSGDTARHASHV